MTNTTVKRGTRQQMSKFFITFLNGKKTPYTLKMITFIVEIEQKKRRIEA